MRTHYYGRKKTMQQMEYDCLLKFIEIVLDDDRGISEHAYLRLRQLADSMFACRDHAERSHLIEGMIERIDATNGRYYLSKK